MSQYAVIPRPKRSYERCHFVIIVLKASTLFRKRTMSSLFPRTVFMAAECFIMHLLEVTSSNLYR